MISNSKTNNENNLVIDKTPYQTKKMISLVLHFSKVEKKNFTKNNNKNNINTELSNHHINENEMKNQNKNRRPTLQSVKKILFNENDSSNQYIINSEENNENYGNKRHNIILWTYFQVTNLMDGQIFGDVALSENNKRRNASIITQENTICGTLDNKVYNRFIKDAQKKIRKNIVHSLLNVNFLNGINGDIFEEHYFNMFKYDCIHRNDYLYQSGEERNSIYIVTSGEIETSITCTVQLLNKILKIKNVILN